MIMFTCISTIVVQMSQTFTVVPILVSTLSIGQLSAWDVLYTHTVCISYNGDFLGGSRDY